MPIGRRPDRWRAWLDPEGAAEADLKKRTLTNLYNQRPTWLANAHARLDRAVWAAYGWDDPDPAVVADDVILSRLLALNLERAAQAIVGARATRPRRLQPGAGDPTGISARGRAPRAPTNNVGSS